MKYKRILLALAVLLLIITPVFAQPGVVILNYHHVGPYITSGNMVNLYTVTPQALRSHFEYLKQQGYTVISLDDYIQYNRGEKNLPEKSVMITFDDAYVSFYAEAFPLLKEYNYPAVLATVGVWQQVPPTQPDRILNWEQLREIKKSGLVEIASHSYNLHHQIIINSFGDVSQMATALEFAGGKFEELDFYKKRLQADMAQGQELFEKELGQKARVLVWPYGEYNAIALEAALEAGFEVTFGLEGGINPRGESSLHAAKRGIIYKNPSIEEFAKFLSEAGDTEKKIRAIQVDIDSLYDPDKRQLEANINALMYRMERTKANAVYLQAFADDKGDGNIEKVYFKNSVAPVKADVFSHVVQRLNNGGVRVYAWLPTLTGQWLVNGHPEDVVQAYDEKGKGWYNRATPFSPRVREQLKTMARELAMYAQVSGVMFQDDLYLNDYEDFFPCGETGVFKALWQGADAGSSQGSGSESSLDKAEGGDADRSHPGSDCIHALFSSQFSLSKEYLCGSGYRSQGGRMVCPGFSGVPENL